MNLIWSQSVQWLLISGIRNIPEALIMPMGAPMWALWENDNDIAYLQAKTIPMNLIWSESAQCLLSYGSVRKIPVAYVAPTGEWPYVAHVQVETVPVSLIWSESAQWLLSSSVLKVRRANFPGALITPVSTPIRSPMGKWPRRCTSIG